MSLWTAIFGQPRIKVYKHGKIVDNNYVRQAFRFRFPSLDLHEFHFADAGQVWVLPSRDDEDAIFNALPYIDRSWMKVIKDCDKWTRHRRVQIDEFLIDHTDIPIGFTLGVWTIAGYTNDGAGHAMLAGIGYDGEVYLRQPYNGEIEWRAKKGFLRDPWFLG